MLYFDSAAATPLDPKVFEAMRPWLTVEYANPNAVYQPAQRARAAIDDARTTVANFLKAKPTEIIFTGSGTESCNMAIRGVVEHSFFCVIPTKPSSGGRREESLARDSSTSLGMTKRGKTLHVITSSIEHSSVLKPLQYLEKLLGIEVTYLPVNRDGFISPDDFERAIRRETIFASIMLVNNQIGTIQPISEIGKICRERGIVFHTDACQGPGYLDLDVNRLNVDLLNLNASKIYGPKGVGALYVREGVKIAPLIHGGGQEFKLRAGTENVAGIVGMGKAVELLIKENHAEQVRKLRDQLWVQLQRSIKGIKLNGSIDNRIANSLNIRIPGADARFVIRSEAYAEGGREAKKAVRQIEKLFVSKASESHLQVDAEMLVRKLDLEAICVATTAACVSGITEPSHVLKAIGLTDDEAKSSIRITLGKHTTEEEIQILAQALKKLL